MNFLIMFYMCLSGYIVSGYLFNQRVYKFKISQKIAAASQIGKLSLIDTNGSHVDVDWRPQSKYFEFDPITLAIRTTEHLSIPKGSYYFQATSYERQRSLSNCYISIQVQDESVNHRPKFLLNPYQFQVFENNAPDTLIGQVEAVDPDLDENGRLTYHLINENSAPSPFHIKSDTGQIFAKRSLNSEKQNIYDLKITAVDNSADKLSVTSHVSIRVVSQYDFQPILNSNIYNISLDENTDFTKRPAIFSVTGFDRHTNSSILAYSLWASLDDLNTFEIDNTGTVHLVSKLNFKMKNFYTLSIYARDHGQPSCSVKSKLNIHIVNRNPSFVTFSAPFYEFIAFEDLSIGSKIGRVVAYDRDQPNSPLGYKLIGQVPFKIERNGLIVATSQVRTKVYEFYVTATDSKSKSSVKVKVKILDSNDLVPQFAKKIYKLSISEDTAIGLPLLTLNVINKEPNSLLDFSLEQDQEDLFSLIRQSSSRVFLTLEKSNLNFKKKSFYELNVRVMDQQDGLYSISKIEITISPNTKYFPRFTSDVYSFRVNENSAINSLVGSLSTVSSDSQVIFRLNTATVINNDFRLDDQTGNLYVANYLDRENYNSITLYASVSYRDKNFRSDHALIQIQILDINDNAPVFSRPFYRAFIYTNTKIDNFVMRAEATDQDEGLNSLVKYSILEPNSPISVDKSSGVVRLKSLIDKDCNLTLLASDSGSPMLSTKSFIILKYIESEKSAPIFDTSYVFDASEALTAGSVVGELSARVADTEYQSDIIYKLIDTNFFQLKPSGKFNRVYLVAERRLETSVNLTVRAYSGSLHSDCVVQVKIKKMKKILPMIGKKFKIVFNHFKNYFLTEQAPRVPVQNYDPVFNWTFSVTDKIGRQLVNIEPKTGRITLRSVLNSNNLINTSFVVLISDESGSLVNSTCELIVTMVTENMISQSVSLVINGLYLDSFMDFYYENFTQLVAEFFAKFKKTHVHLFNLAGQTSGFNLSISVSYDLEKDKFVPSSILKQILYTNMDRLKNLMRIKKIVIYEDKSCSIEPCLNYQKCSTVSKFNSADSNYLSSALIQFRSVSIRHDFSCSCPLGFTGNISVMCDTEINLCYSNPCGQNGICMSTESSYVCICDPGFTGHSCEINIKQSKCSQLDQFKLYSNSESFMSASLCRGNSKCKNLILGGFVCDECNGNDEPSAKQYYSNLCELKTVNFPENSGAYLVLAGLENRIRFKLKLTFSTINSNGVLFYNGRLEDDLDFVSLVIENDFLNFKFSLGDSVNEIKINEISVTDAKWRTVTIEYKSRSVYLLLDDDNLENVDSCQLANSSECISKIYTYNLPSKCQSQIETCSRFFDLNGPLIIGQGLRKKNSFEGCISNLFINDKLIDLEHDSFVSHGIKRGCSPKMNLCDLDKTKFGSQCSKCSHIWSNEVKCDCLNGDFDGSKCVESRSAEPVLNTQTNSYFLFQEKVLESEKLVSISMNLRLKKTNSLSNQTIVYVKFSDNLIFNEFFVYYDPKAKSLVLISQNIRNQIRLEINKNELFSHRYWSNLLLSFKSDGHVTLQLDTIFKKSHLSKQIKNLFDQKFNYRWSIGAYKSPSFYPSSTGVYTCIKNIQLNKELVLPYETFNVSKGCDVSQSCEKLAHSVYYANSSCLLDSCPASACHNSGNCSLVDQEYECTCPEGFKGKYCEYKKQKVTINNFTCPARWWGIEPGICGPCACDETKNFSPDCDKRSGKCECKPKFYKRVNKVSGEEECVPCDCYLEGSSSLECEDYTGQCTCLPGAGITGIKCDRCVSPFAEMTLKGNECRQIMSDQCPKAHAFNTWWPRTDFNKIANSSCPRGSIGTAYRSCTADGWMSSVDLTECRSLSLNSLTSLETVTNSYQAFKLVEQLNGICTKAENADETDLISFENSNLLSTSLNSLYAMDILLIRNATKLILEYEINNTALFIQDKFFVNKIFYIIDRILSKKYELKINQFNYKTSNEFGQWSELLMRISEFMSVLVKNGHEYTLSDELALNYDNLEFGQNVAPKSSNGFFIESGSKFAFSSMNIASYNLPIHLSLRHGSLSTLTYRVVSNIFMLNTNKESNEAKVEFLLSNNYDVVYDPVKNHLSYNNLRNSKSDYICVRLNKDYKIWSSIGAKFVSYEPNSNVVTCQFDDSEGIFAVITPVATFVRNKNNILNFTIGFSILVGLSLIILSISMILIISIKKTRRPLKVVQLNLCLNIYLNQLIFIIGVNANESQILCKLVSILEHYFNLSTFFWTFLISLHLYRMVSELRDVNKIGVSTPVFYYLIGYIAPLIMVTLSLGIKNDIYTNYQATVNFLNYPKYKLDISSVYCWLNINSYNEIFFIFILPIGTMSVLVLLLSMLSYKESKKNTFNQTDLNSVNQNLLIVILFLPFNCLMAIFLFLFLSSSLTSQTLLAMVYQHLFAVCSLIFSVVIFASLFVLDSENRECLIHFMTKKLDNCKKISVNEASLKGEKKPMDKIEVVNVNSVNAKYMAYRDFNTQSFSTTSTSENTDNSQISEYVKHMFVGNQNGYFPNLINTTNTDTTESDYNYNYDFNKLNGINNTQSIQECDVVDVGKVLMAKNPSIQNVIGENYRCKSPFAQTGAYVYSPSRFDHDIMSGMNTLPKVNKPMQISPQFSENMSAGSKNSLVHVNPDGTIERKYFKKANIASVASIKINTSVNIDSNLNLNHDDNETRV